MRKTSNRQIQYNVENFDKIHASSASVYFEKKLQPQDNTNWNHVFLLPRKVTIESKMRIFQYKILRNILFLNAKLFKMKIIDSPLCSLCREENGTTWHLFSQCKVTTHYWKSLQIWLKPSINLPDLTPESALLGLNTVLDNNKYTNTLINHLILIFKKSLYEMRLRPIPSSVHYIKIRIAQIKKIEFQIAHYNNKLDFHFKKWEPISDQIDTFFKP